MAQTQLRYGIMVSIIGTLFKYKEKESPDELGLFPERVHVDALI